MPQTSIYGHMIPSLTDGPPDITTALTDFGGSIHPTIVAATLTEASTLTANFPVGVFPVFAAITGETSLYMRLTSAGAWERIGGRDHGFKASLFQSNLPKNEYKNLGIGPVKKASEGWAISADQVELTFPEDGIYGVKVMLDVNGVSTQITKARCQFTINGAWAGRVTLDNDDIITPTTFVDVAKGDKLCTFYHWAGTGGPMSVQSGELLVFRAAKPRWS